MVSLGQVVFSLRGHDKGNSFIVVHIQNEYLFLADGRLRLFEQPKKKKVKHVQTTNITISDIKERLEKNQYLLDSDIRKALKPYPGLGKSIKEVYDPCQKAML